MDSHSGGLSLLHRQPSYRLVLSHRSLRWTQWPFDSLCPRQSAGWLFFDQRDGVYARTGARLRRMGGAGQSRLVLERRVSGVQAQRGSLRRWQRNPWRGRRMAGGRAAPRLENPARVARCGRAVRYPQDRGFQWRRQLRLRPFSGEPAHRRSMERVQGVSAAGHAASQSHGPHQCTGTENHSRHPLRRTPRARHRVCEG